MEDHNSQAKVSPPLDFFDCASSKTLKRKILIPAEKPSKYAKLSDDCLSVSMEDHKSQAKITSSPLDFLDCALSETLERRILLPVEKPPKFAKLSDECLPGSDAGSLTSQASDHSLLLPKNKLLMEDETKDLAKIMEDEAEDLANKTVGDELEGLAKFAITHYNRCCLVTNPLYEVEQIEEATVDYRHMSEVYRLKFTAKDAKSGKLDTFRATVWVLKNMPPEEAKSVICRKLEQKVEPSLESKIQRAVKISSSFFPTVLHDKPMPVVWPVEPPVRLHTNFFSMPRKERMAIFEKRVREGSGFMLDLNPDDLRPLGCGPRHGPLDYGDIYAARDENYLNLAKLAITAYNNCTMNTTNFEVEQIEKVNVKERYGITRIVYDLTFTARDNRCGLETFEAVVRVYLGNRGGEEPRTVESCMIKTVY